MKLPVSPILIFLALAATPLPAAESPPTTVNNTVCMDGCTLPLGHLLPTNGTHYEVLSPWSEIDPPPS